MSVLSDVQYLFIEPGRPTTTLGECEVRMHIVRSTKLGIVTG